MTEGSNVNAWVVIVVTLTWLDMRRYLLLIEFCKVYQYRFASVWILVCLDRRVEDINNRFPFRNVQTILL